MLSRKIRLYIYYIVIFLLSFTIFFVFQHITSKHPSDYLYTEKCILCLISSFFNLFVLYFHYTNAPHPKFVILPQRRFFIYVHIISGVTEFITCWIVFCTGNQYVATFAALVAIICHVPSAYYQTSIAFGAKALIVSAYLFAISLHLFCALHLFFEPSSTYWLLNMFLILNVYVWCRVFYFFFGFVGLFSDTRYTNSTLTSGLLLVPAVLGVSANMLFCGYVGISILLYLFIVRPNEEDRARFVGERTRELLVNKNIHDQWLKEKTRLTRMTEDSTLTDQQQAKKVFDLLDKDKNGYLDGDEITDLLRDWQVAEAFIKKFFRWSKDKHLTFNDFYNHVWCLGETSIKFQKQSRKKEDSAKARFVFDCLDHDSNEYIDSLELQKLLIEWGLPDNEVDAYLADDDDKRYSFDEFYHNMKPVWNFAYENMSVKNGNQDTQPFHPHSN